jgi:hypothetical protein
MPEHHIVSQNMKAYPIGASSPTIRSRSRPSGSLAFPFVFLLDFLLVVPDIERNFGKNGVTRVGNLISEIVISYPTVI